MLYEDRTGLKFREIQLPLPPLSFWYVELGLGRIADVTHEVDKLLRQENRLKACSAVLFIMWFKTFFFYPVDPGPFACWTSTLPFSSSSSPFCNFFL